jgi:hypothetical protein
MDRIAVGIKSDRPNCGYLLRFFTPGWQGNAPDNLLTFYFGGPYGAPHGTVSTNTASGAFCAVMHGNGLGTLFAYDDFYKVWFTAQGFQFAPPGDVMGRYHVISFEPKGRNVIGIRVGMAGAAQTHGRGNSEGPSYGNQPPDPTAARYSANIFVGMPPGRTVTGIGNPRIDVRRDLLIPWQITRGLYPAAGKLVGHNAIFKHDPNIDAAGAGPYVLLKMYHVPYAQGLITPKLYHDNDETAEITGSQIRGDPYGPCSTWRFDVSGLGTRSFGVTYYFTSDGLGTPHLQRIILLIVARWQNSVGLKQELTPNQATVTGFDGDPSRPTGSFVFEDLLGEGELLRRRGRLRAKIQVAYVEKIEAKTGTLGATEPVLVSNLLDGEISDCPAELKGFAMEPYPSPDWHRFEASMVGMWSRCSDQFNFHRAQFWGGDDSDPTTGDALPPRVTDVIYQIFSQTLGLPDSELDIPDVDIRWLPMGKDADYALQAKQNPLEFVRRLAEDFLGYSIRRDDNAGPLGTDFAPAGMWRLRPRLSFGTEYPALASFVFGPDVSKAPTPVHWPGSYPPLTYPIWRGTYRGNPEAPACNYVLVIAADDRTKMANDAGQWKAWADVANGRSFNFDPDNPTATNRRDPDFLGRFVPLVVVDFSLAAVRDEDGGPHGACRALAYALMDNLGHGRKWVTFRAPLALVWDPNDPLQTRRRMLSFDDPILVNGFPSLLKSCHPAPPLYAGRMDGLYQAVLQNGVWTGVGSAATWKVDPNGQPPM